MLEGIKVYCLDISNMNRDKYQYFKSKISEERRKKADKFRFIEDSYRCVCAELLVKYSLYVNNLLKDNLDFICNDYGKPYLKNYNNTFFNVSHSGDRVVVALAATEVGIDVEKIQSGLEGSVDMLYTEKEKYYTHLANSDKEFDERMVQIWTMKESFCKLLGLGLSAGIEKYCVNPKDGTVTDPNGIIQKSKITNLPIQDNYCISVCGFESISSITWIDTNDLFEII